MKISADLKRKLATLNSRQAQILEDLVFELAMSTMGEDAYDVALEADLEKVIYTEHKPNQVITTD